MRIDWATRWICTLLLGVAGCADPLEAPSAFQEERFLCGPEHAAEFDAWATACRDDPACPGVGSIKGEFGGQPFVADTTLFNTYYVLDSTVLADVGAQGTSPYFEFRISLEMLTREIVDGAERCLANSSLFGIEVRGSSGLQALNLKTCQFEPRLDGLYLAFTASLPRASFLATCMYFAPPRRGP